MALPILRGGHLGAGLAAGGRCSPRCATVDAARETARAVARGDPTDSAVARGRQVAPPGAALTVVDRHGRGSGHRQRSPSTARAGSSACLPGVRVHRSGGGRPGGPRHDPSRRRGSATLLVVTFLAVLVIVGRGSGGGGRDGRGSPPCPVGRRPRRAGGGAGAGSTARTDVPPPPASRAPTTPLSPRACATGRDVLGGGAGGGPQVAGAGRRLLRPVPGPGRAERRGLSRRRRWAAAGPRPGRASGRAR